MVTFLQKIREWLEKAKEVLRKWAEFLSEKTKDVAERTKLKLERGRLEREMDKKFTQLGRECYEIAKNGKDESIANPGMRGLIEDIKRINERLNQCQIQLGKKSKINQV